MIEAMAKPFALALLVVMTGGYACRAIATEGAPAMTTRIDSDGLEYRKALAGLIRRADRIVVTEHSYLYDAYDADAGKSLIPNEVVYGRHPLSPSQRDFFQSLVDGLDPTTQDAFAACIFEPHHRIEFYAAGERISTMAICFKCSQVKWDATSAIPPWSLYSGLAALMEEVGFSSERDWVALAKQHLGN